MPTDSAPRMIAFDLDGTLLGADYRVSPRTTEALHRAAAAGTLLVIATGRPIEVVRGYLDGIDPIHLIVSVNGGAIHDNATGALVWEATFPMASARTVVGRARAAVPGVRFAVLGPGYAAEERGFSARVPVTTPQPEVHDVLTLDEQLVTRLGAFHDDIHARELVELLAPHAPFGVEATFGGLDVVEFLAAGTDKAAALARVAADRGIERSEVVVFGDAVNDWGMLGWAGRSYAMANADDVTREYATHTAPHHADDGVAQVLEAMFP